MNLTIDRQDDTVLAVRLRPGWPMPLVLGIAGLAAAALLAGSQELHLTKTPEGRIDAVLHTHLAGCRTGITRISDVRDAQVQEQETPVRRRSANRSSHTVQSTYRIRLLDGQGQAHPLTPHFSSGHERKSQLAGAIRTFISEPRGSTTVVRQPVTPWVFAVLAVPVLAVAMALSGRASCTIDRANHVVRLVRWSPIGPRNMDIPLNEVRHFQLLTSRRQRRPTFNAGLIRISGEEVPLTHLWTSRSAPVSALVNRLEDYRQASDRDRSRHRGGSESAGAAKICVLCGQDCSDAPRLMDAGGRYFHQACYDAAHSRTA